MLKQLHVWSSSCWASTASLVNITKSLFADLDGGLSSRGFSQDIFKDRCADDQHGGQGQKKWRRLDEEMKRVATVDAVVHGRVHTGSQLCMAAGCATDSAARK